LVPFKPELLLASPHRTGCRVLLNSYASGVFGTDLYLTLVSVNVDYLVSYLPIVSLYSNLRVVNTNLRNERTSTLAG
jgi:hypothetical protein